MVILKGSRDSYHSIRILQAGTPFQRLRVMSKGAFALASIRCLYILILTSSSGNLVYSAKRLMIGCNSRTLYHKQAFIRRLETPSVISYSPAERQTGNTNTCSFLAFMTMLLTTADLVTVPQPQNCFTFSASPPQRRKRTHSDVEPDS